MSTTQIRIDNDSFLINDKPVYSEIPGNSAQVHGLLMNARFIQGIFDDKAAPRRFNRFGRIFDPEKNTDNLIAALPQWYAHGLRAITVGFQGGGPCFTTHNDTIENNPFGSDGKELDSAYARRMDRLIRAADAIGMIIIVSYFYGSQCRFLADGKAVRHAVITASRFLRENNYTNVLIEIANEHDVKEFKNHPIIQTAEGIASLIELAKQESGGIPISSSAMGGSLYKEVCEASDYVLIHGNGCSRQRFYNLIQEAKGWANNKPIVCNEDSPAISQIPVALANRVSWGYYNNFTKQEPPTDWRILDGEDLFFATNIASAIGLNPQPIAENKQFMLMGFENDMHVDGKRWIRLASLNPEQIDRVDFYCNSQLYYTCYDDPFTIHFNNNWLQGSVDVDMAVEKWHAEVFLHNGKTILVTPIV